MHDVQKTLHVFGWIRPLHELQPSTVPVVRAGAGVDLQLALHVTVKRSGALRIELQCCLAKAFRITAREDDACALCAGAAGGFQSDARAATDDDHGLAYQFRWALLDSDTGYGGQNASGGPMRLTSDAGELISPTARGFRLTPLLWTLAI